ncbi:hypothetical protein L596_016619 [Steinernema carpocapsae]|uniref:Small ribosomal subunit protein eS25 n=1 Tax=Steinernema carpocapsae TaxID=34508 RepID=A0A4U5NJD6_STECR|nr:hypothetical protein L596_016619 [Steinernema carpocapsae]
MPPKTSKKADAKGGKPVKKDSSGGKGKKKKWSKGKVRDKLNNMALFDKATYDKLYKEVSAPRSLALPNPISAPGRDLQAHHPIGCFRTSEGPCLACQAGSSRASGQGTHSPCCQPQQPTGLHPCHQDRRNRRLSTSLLLVFVSNKVFIPFINRVPESSLILTHRLVVGLDCMRLVLFQRSGVASKHRLFGSRRLLHDLLRNDLRGEDPCVVDSGGF